MAGLLSLLSFRTMLLMALAPPLRSYRIGAHNARSGSSSLASARSFACTAFLNSRTLLRAISARRPFMLYCVFASAAGANPPDDAPSATTTRGFAPAADAKTQYNMKGLRAEIARKSVRLFKKAVQANDRVSRALASSEDDPDLAHKLEALRLEASLAGDQLREVKALEEAAAGVRSSADPLFAPLLPVILKYDISDTPPPPPERGPKKAKSAPKAAGPRMPYATYTSADGIEIRVGRRAEDNDELSCSAEHRDGADWWMHVAGHPGSHVVIRSHDDDLPLKFRETLKDAAVLAASNSKAGSSAQVTYTRCRNVSKPPGAKAGLVHLRGDVATVRVNLKTEQDRLNRLNGVAPAAPEST